MAGWSLSRERRGEIVRAMAAAVLAGTSLFAIDRLRAMGAGDDVEMAALAAPTLWAGHVLLAFVAVAIAGVGRAVGRRLPAPARDTWIGRIGAPALVALLAGASALVWAGTQLTAGEWIARQWFAPLVRWAPLGLGIALAPALAWVTFAAPTTGRRGRVVTLGLVLGLVGSQLVDHRVAPGIHPEIHLLLHAAAVVAATLVLHRVLGAMPRPSRRTGLTLGVVTIAASLAAPALWLGMSNASRRQLVLHAPLARLWIRHAMPAPRSTLLVDVLSSESFATGRYDPEVAAAPRGLVDGRDYNVVLIVVDTMRSDSVPPARPEGGLPFVRAGDTPNLDAWISGAYRFSHAYTVSTKTHRTMPSIFRSTQITDDIARMGVPLALRMAALGRSTAAVTLDYFLSSKFRQVTALVEGFEDMTFYEKKHADESIPAAIEALQGLKDERFFLWLHLYYVHSPGFDGRLLDDSDCGRVECYRRSLRYLDGELGKLLAAIDDLDLEKNTIVVLTADHGEGLFDHGLEMHGPNVFDEDVRVPLAIAIPGRDGAVIDAPVGTIDIAPTLVDLLGGPVEPQDRGRSLVPLMLGHDVPPRAYYFENNDSTVAGVVMGHQKLVYDTASQVASRYDLDADPDEVHDVFDPQGELDRALLHRLVDFQPEIIAEELDDDDALELVASRIGEIDPNAPPAALPLLVRLVEQRPKQTELVRGMSALFTATEDRNVRLLLARHLHRAAPRTFSKLLREWLASVADTPAELEIVTALAAQAQPAFSRRQISARVAHWARVGTPEQWPPYLRLVRPWKWRTGALAEPLATMLDRAATDTAVPDSVLELVLEVVAELEPGADANERLVAAIRPLLADPEARIRGKAARALGSLGSRADLPVLRQKLAGTTEDPRVRRDCAAALVAILGDDAVPELIALAEAEPAMTRLVFRQIDRMNSPAALPWLRTLQRDHYNSYIRKGARRAIKRINARQKKREAALEADAGAPG